jgi:hypothetical protein
VIKELIAGAKALQKRSDGPFLKADRCPTINSLAGYSQMITSLLFNEIKDKSSIMIFEE